MSNLVKFVPAAMKANAAALECLEDMKARVASGEIQEIAIVGVTSDGRTTSGWSHCTNFNTLIGGVARLQHRLNSALDNTP